MDNNNNNTDPKAAVLEQFNAMLQKLYEQPPETQLAIGAVVGFGSAMVSMKIVKMIAFVAGGTVLFSALASDPRNRMGFDVNVNLNGPDLANLFDVDNNSLLTTGFIGGYLLGFSYSWKENGRIETMD